MDFKQLWSLAGLCLRHPLFVFPTYVATRKTIKICDQKFGKAHHKNGRANAFRHALWNALIIHKCNRWGSIDKTTAWAKRITDWHEDFSVNAALARAMDLHNNQIGRTFARKHRDSSESQLVQLVMVLIPLSRKHTTIQQMQEHPDTLTHIEDD
ncbi:DUF6973 domain-containing protein [Dokdonia ponticola]|uniref:DUF6973 domain-containing protein n=1 Tax=Dokdonia ponticola TaxID=2041041 RepID=A0ABV9HVW9_9FLAO